MYAYLGAFAKFLITPILINSLSLVVQAFWIGWTHNL